MVNQLIQELINSEYITYNNPAITEKGDAFVYRLNDGKLLYTPVVKDFPYNSGSYIVKLNDEEFDLTGQEFSRLQYEILVRFRKQ